ncbi:MAG: ATP-binding protein [Acidimicrobiales bacterium]
MARHAPGGACAVKVTYEPGALLIEVEDDGRAMARSALSAAAGSVAGAGSGIAGMRERAVALGGRLEAGLRPGGGFRVAAYLPLEVAQ